MPIKVVCPACQTALAVKDEYAGKRGKCPKCQGAIQIPAAAPVAAGVGAATPTISAAASSTRPAPAKAAPGATKPPTNHQPAAAPPANKQATLPKSPEEWKTAVLGGFREGGGAELSKQLPGGGMGLLFQAGLMSGLVAGYVIVLGAIGFGLYWWGMNGASYGTAFYIAPLVMGGLALLCLLRPLVAPANARGSGRELKAKDEPLVTEFVEKLCDSISCQKPQRIEVDGGLETWAGKQGGKLVLRLGLPLAAVLSVEHMAGLIAGQLGQYPAGKGTPQRRFVRSVYRWYTRAVFGNDAWDEKLIAAARRRTAATAWIYHALRILPRIGTLLLWPLAIMARTFGEGTSQALDKHGDLCALTLVGRQTFLGTGHRLKIVRFLWSQVQGDIGLQIREQQVPDNLPQVLINQLRDTPKEVLDLATGIDEGPGDPADNGEKERLAAAQQFTGDPLFTCPLPATGLFREYAGVAKVVTQDFYAHTFGKQFSRVMLRKV